MDATKKPIRMTPTHNSQNSQQAINMKMDSMVQYLKQSIKNPEDEEDSRTGQGSEIGSPQLLKKRSPEPQQDFPSFIIPLEKKVKRGPLNLNIGLIDKSYEFNDVIKQFAVTQGSAMNPQEVKQDAIQEQDNSFKDLINL